MHPNELNNAMKEADKNLEKMQVLSARVGSILDTYRMAFIKFLESPEVWPIPLAQVASWPKHQQKDHFEAISQTLLIASTQATLVGEHFHAKEIIRAAEKLTPAPISIPGVATPELSGPGNWTMSERCACGHEYGRHTDADKGPCLEMECNCKHFEQKPQGEKGKP